MSTLESRHVRALAVKERGGKLQPIEYKLDPLTPNGVGIEIHYCGLNTNDIHLINGDWGEVCRYPHVPGHEITGIVSEIGSEVKYFKQGDRVGVGMVKEACLHCDFCVFGHENQCENMKAMNCPSGQCVGGLADFIRVDQSMVFKIPDNIPLSSAAPLMCSGASVWNPLIHYSHENDRVGVLGFGNLGHLAVKFARRRGQPVCVIDRDSSKEKEALEMGAHFIDNSDPSRLQTPEFQHKIDLLLVLVENIDIKSFLPLMRKNGTICMLAASTNQIIVPTWPDLLYKQLHICGSFLAGRADTRTMFQFCSKNQIASEVQTYPLNKANEAIEDKIHNRIPCPTVIEIKTEGRK